MLPPRRQCHMNVSNTECMPTAHKANYKFLRGQGYRALSLTPHNGRMQQVNFEEGILYRAILFVFNPIKHISSLF